MDERLIGTRHGRHRLRAVAPVSWCQSLVSFPFLSSLQVVCVVSGVVACVRRTAGVVVAALVLLAAGGASPAAALSPASQSHITEITEHLYRGSQFVQSCGTGSVCTELWSAEQALDASTADGEAILRGLRTLRQKIGVLPSFGDGSCIDFPTNRDFAGWYTFGSRPVYYKLGSIRRQDASPGSLFATWWKACMRRTPHNLDFGASLHASGWVAEVMYNFNLYRR